MAAEGEVGKHGTSEFGRWNTEFEHKLNDFELREADRVDDQANDCVEAEEEQTYCNKMLKKLLKETGTAQQNADLCHEEIRSDGEMSPRELGWRPICIGIQVTNCPAICVGSVEDRQPNARGATSRTARVA